MIKDTLKIDLDLMYASISRDCNIKYARKLLQDELKKTMPGGWYCSCQNLYDDEDETYEFELYNRYYFITKTLEYWSSKK